MTTFKPTLNISETCQLCGMPGVFKAETLHLCPVCFGEHLNSDRNSQGAWDDFNEGDPFAKDIPEEEWIR
jgi:hypothetical protein